MFIQYISHEARGPLQVANMGLELHLQDLVRVSDDCANGTNSFSSVGVVHTWLGKCKDHIDEIMDSCLLAQNTLNDMLTYDKIESGMLQIDKTVITLIPFVVSEFRSFAIPVSTSILCII